MPGVRIVTDSACDLSPEQAEAHGIVVVPLTIRFGTEELLDRRDLTPAEFWRRCASGGALPETAAPPPGAFRDAFDAAAAEGCSGVVCVNISSDLSATYASARTAAEGIGEKIAVRVIDTRSVTMGEGLIVLACAEAAEQGADVETVAKLGESLIGRVRVYGLVDTLDHLQRGGRVGGAAAMIGSLLSIKPVLEVRDGTVHEESKQRTRSKSLQYLANKVRSDLPIERFAVASGAASDLESFLALVEDIPSDHPRVLCDLGPVVGTHSGPGTIGACYIIKDGATRVDG